MKIIKAFFIFSLLSLNLSYAADGMFFKQEEAKLIVNNRILANVNNKAISAVDVMKKMDVLFYREFPQYASSIQARYQFYKVNWKHVLNELVNKELVLADAVENKLPVTGGDVRQEMEALFGPNIINNLDKLGMSYDEAQKIVQGDITLRRMIYVRVNSIALKKITPSVVKAAYEEYAKNPENSNPDIWQYQVISIRDSDKEKAFNTANILASSLNQGVRPSDLLNSIEKEGSKVSVSEEFALEEKDISENYKAVLSKMQPKTHSDPIEQKARADSKESIYRIFVFNDLKKGGVLSFNEIEPKLKDKLLEDEVGKETEKYLTKLKRHHHVEEGYLKNEDKSYEPFSMN